METLTTSWSLIVLKDLSQYWNNGTCYNSWDIVNCNGSEWWPKIVDWNAPTWKAMSFDWVDDWIIVPWKSDTGIINDMTFISKIKHSWAQEANNWWGWRIISLKGINGEIYSRIDDTLKGDGITPTPQGRLGILFWLILSWTVNELNWIPNSLAWLDTNYHIISNTKWNKIVNYLDGVKKTESNNTIWLMETKSSFYIWWANPNTANFSWEIEEVRIYNRSLSDQEILQQAKNAGLYR